MYGLLFTEDDAYNAQGASQWAGGDMHIDIRAGPGEGTPRERTGNLALGTVADMLEAIYPRICHATAKVACHQAGIRLSLYVGIVFKGIGLAGTPTLIFFKKTRQ